MYNVSIPQRKPRNSGVIGEQIMYAAHFTNVTLPKLSTVKNLPTFFPAVDLTIAAIHGHIFKAQDRFDSKGRKIAGNGLANTGAIIRRGRKVLINVDKYAAWLSSGVTA